jgi:hypothetical protein
MALDLIVKNWPLLVENVNHLDKLTSSTRRNLSDFQVSVEGDITMNELRAQSFLGTIGSRSSANFGTSSIWGALSELHQGMEHSSQNSYTKSSDLQRELAAANLKLDSLFSDPSFIQNLKRQTGADINSAISPFQVVLKDFLSPFFWKYTSHQAAVDCGDKLEARLTALEAGMASKPLAATTQASGFFPFRSSRYGFPNVWASSSGSSLSGVSSACPSCCGPAFWPRWFVWGGWSSTRSFRSLGLSLGYADERRRVNEYQRGRSFWCRCVFLWGASSGCTGSVCC